MTLSNNKFIVLLSNLLYDNKISMCHDEENKGRNAIEIYENVSMCILNDYMSNLYREIPQDITEAGDILYSLIENQFDLVIRMDCDIDIVDKIVEEFISKTLDIIPNSSEEFDEKVKKSLKNFYKTYLSTYSATSILKDFPSNVTLYTNDIYAPVKVDKFGARIELENDVNGLKEFSIRLEVEVANIRTTRKK